MKISYISVLLLLSVLLSLTALVVSVATHLKPVQKDAHFHGTITIHDPSSPGDCVVINGKAVIWKVVNEDGSIGARSMTYEDLYGKSSGQASE